MDARVYSQLQGQLRGERPTDELRRNHKRRFPFYSPFTGNCLSWDRCIAKTCLNWRNPDLIPSKQFACKLLRKLRLEFAASQR